MLLFIAGGCGDALIEPGDDASPRPEPSEDDGWDYEPTPATPVEDDEDDEPGTDSEPEPSPISSGFITDPDGGIQSYECSLYEQDCAPDEKCNVWANDGGSSWNATKCVAVDPDPDLVGEQCHVEGSGVSGIDSCERGAFCWDVDPEEGLGMCVSFCQGTDNAPTCDNPREYPAAGKEFCLCLERCEPLLQDCPVGCGCYATEDRFQCVPDASGPDIGLFGDACEFTNGCDPGLNCTNAEFVDCDSTNCCTSFCDLSMPDTCPNDYECQSVYAEGEVVPGYEDVGLCMLPGSW
ncbi:MAG: hypothetical protein ACE37F_14490 [Nannocystaceae bacterium]|nr:procyclic acidic repetitive family protein [bacterium]